ncbi:MAG: adenylyl-sulfate kinase [Jiangellaceae bacterium]|nr:adenylyl-sulfate kinase [Jiangellaceae bacterium]
MSEVRVAAVVILVATVAIDEALPDGLASWPAFHPTPAVLGKVELLLAGVGGPTVAVDVPASIAAAAESGHLVLTDEEGTPLADVAVHTVSTGDDGKLCRVSGPVRGLRPFSGGPFRSLRRRPDEVRVELAGTPAVGVPLSRPLIADDEQAFAEYATARGARLLLLPCVAEAGPAGLPPEVLVRAVLASGSRLGTPAGPALVVPLPLEPSTDAAAPPLSVEFVKAAGGTLVDPELLPNPRSWSRIAAALDSISSALEGLVAADVAAVLRSWRPPRTERGLTVFFTGLSGSGKSTLAHALTDAILERGRTVTLVDGDVARRQLASGLGFSRTDRDLNVRRIGWVAAEITRHGGVAVCALIAPYAASRAEVRRRVQAHGHFVLVHVATPLEVCEQRDRKGLYAKARAGLIEEFTGVSDPYEEPEDADVRVDTSQMTIDVAVDAILAHLLREGLIEPS